MQIDWTTESILLHQNANLKKTKGHGWCGTSMNDDISEPEFDIQPDSGKIFLSSNFP